MSQDFIDLEGILKFLPRKNFTDTKNNTHQVGGKLGNYFPQSHLLPFML